MISVNFNWVLTSLTSPAALSDCNELKKNMNFQLDSKNLKLFFLTTYYVLTSNWNDCHKIFHLMICMLLNVKEPSTISLLSSLVSMTSLLTHTVAHSTRPSFRPKTNYQPLKKFLSLVVSWVKVGKNGKILIFKVHFLCQKSSETF